jgi:hypothetical protein
MADERSIEVGSAREYDGVQCVFCTTGNETAIAEELSRMDGVTAIVAKKQKKEWRRGTWCEVRKVLLPGYVFLYRHSALLAPAVSAKLQSMRVLKYNDGSTLLIGRDRQFADWLWKQGGVIGISTALHRGSDVEITGGPLAELDGIITRIDRRKQIAKVTLDIAGGLSVWMSFDYADASSFQDTQAST